MKLLSLIFSCLLLITSLACGESFYQPEIIDDGTEHTNNEENGYQTPNLNPSAPIIDPNDGDIDVPPTRPAPKRPDASRGDEAPVLEKKDNGSIIKSPIKKDATPEEVEALRATVTSNFKASVDEVSKKYENLTTTDFGKDTLDLIASLKLFNNNAEEVSISMPLVSEQIDKLTAQIKSLPQATAISPQERATIFETFKVLADELENFKTLVSKSEYLKNQLIRSDDKATLEDLIKKIDTQTSRLIGIEQTAGTYGERFNKTSFGLKRKFSTKLKTTCSVLSELGKGMGRRSSKEFGELALQLNSDINQMKSESPIADAKPFWPVFSSDQAETLRTAEGITLDLKESSDSLKGLRDVSTPTSLENIEKEIADLYSTAQSTQAMWQNIKAIAR